MSKRKSIAKEDVPSTKKTKGKEEVEASFDEQKARALEWALKQKATKPSRKSVAAAVPISSTEDDSETSSFAHQKVRALEWALKQQMEAEKNKDAANNDAPEPAPTPVKKPTARKTRTKILINQDNGDTNRLVGSLYICILFEQLIYLCILVLIRKQLQLQVKIRHVTTIHQ